MLKFMRKINIDHSQLNKPQNKHEYNNLQEKFKNCYT